MKATNHECYVSLEVAKLLKQAGFDWEVNTCRYISSPDKVSSNGTLTSNFNGYAFQHIAISAPTLDVAQRWLREVKRLNISVNYDPTIKQQPYVCFIYDIDGVYEDIFGDISPITHDYSDGYFYTYEEAQEAGIKKALEIILEK